MGDTEGADGCAKCILWTGAIGIFVCLVTLGLGMPNYVCAVAPLTITGVYLLISNFFVLFIVFRTAWSRDPNRDFGPGWYIVSVLNTCPRDVDELPHTLPTLPDSTWWQRCKTPLRAIIFDFVLNVTMTQALARDGYRHVEEKCPDGNMFAVVNMALCTCNVFLLVLYCVNVEFRWWLAHRYERSNFGQFIAVPKLGPLFTNGVVGCIALYMLVGSLFGYGCLQIALGTDVFRWCRAAHDGAVGLLFGLIMLCLFIFCMFFERKLVTANKLWAFFVFPSAVTSICVAVATTVGWKRGVPFPSVACPERDFQDAYIWTAAMCGTTLVFVTIFGAIVLPLRQWQHKQRRNNNRVVIVSQSVNS
jgi:hypothetical protein